MGLARLMRLAYAGADPFNTPDPALPDCRLATYPHSALPIQLIHRSCDSLVACDVGQQMKFSDPPGYNVAEWAALAPTDSGLGTATVADIIVDYQGNQVANCTIPALCTATAGALNHLRWPDGVADSGGQDWEPTLLGFLRDHPLP